MGFVDLHSKSCCSHTFAKQRNEMADELQQDDFRTAYGLPSSVPISQVRRPVSRPSQGQKILLLKPISLFGFRTVDVSGKPARHRSLPARSQDEALSFGHSWPGLSQYLGKRQGGQGLAHLRRLRPSDHRSSPPALRPRRLWIGTGEDRLRPGFYDHRFVPGTLPLGKVSQTKRSGETAYASRSSRSDPHRGVDYPG